MYYRKGFSVVGRQECVSAVYLSRSQEFIDVVMHFSPFVFFGKTAEHKTFSWLCGMV